MAVEAVASWYRLMRETEDLKNSVKNQISQLCMEMRELESSAGLSEAEVEEKQAELEEECDALVLKLSDLDLETGPKPDFSAMAMTEAERAEAVERLRSDEMQYARRLLEEGDRRGPARESYARRLDFDPKQGGCYFSRYTRLDLDLDEESPFGPMRLTDTPHKIIESKNYTLGRAVNFLSVKVASSDVGFPINVYGTVIVRDSIDERCVYHFRRDGDHCQLIDSEDAPLILTGPKRGLSLCGYMYVEIDLKIKDHLGRHREFSKGLLYINDITRPASPASMVETISLATRLSTVDVTYAVVNRALEGFIAVEVLQGGFHGKITAYTTSVQDELVLYDSKEADVMTVENYGDIQLMRPVVSVHVQDMLTIAVQTSDGKNNRTLFTPMINGRDSDTLAVGATKMLVKLSWSIMD